MQKSCTNKCFVLVLYPPVQCIFELRNYIISEKGASEESSSSLLASLAKMQIFLIHTLNF